MGFLDGILGQTNTEQRKALLKQTHPVYQTHATTWQVGLDAYDGSGGFLSGAYLWRFPREDENQFKRRREQARYHNYTETLVDIYVRAVTTGITRDTNDEALRAWWDDVDGQGTTMDTYIASALGQALASGHAGVLVDKATERAPGPAVADDPNQPYLSTFTSVDMLDWRLDKQGLAAVKLAEEGDPVDMATPADKAAPGTLLWDRDLWARFNAEGELLETDMHGLGVVPLLTLRPKPSRRHPFIGKPLVPPSVAQALYNRASEEDLVLRDQAFSLFVVELPSDAGPDDIQQIETKLGQGVGTTTVMVVKGNTEFRTADMQVPKTIRETQGSLVHEMYRAAHLRFQRDSLDAESAEAIRLQRQDLDSALDGIAQDLQQLEEMIAWLYYAWTAADATRAYEAANVSIQYPSEFASVNIEQELTALGTAIALDLGTTASQELKKRAVTLTLPDLSDETLELVRTEIEAMAGATGSTADTLRQEAAQRLQAAGVEVEAA